MITNTHVLVALKNIGAGASVKDITDILPEEVENGVISTRLCRLRDKGLCVSDLVDGKNRWTITNKGLAELSPAQEPNPEQPPTPEPEPEFISQLEYDPDPEPEPVPALNIPPYSPKTETPDPIAHEPLEALELENDLDQILWRLQSPNITVTARAARVYRRLHAALPPRVQDALTSITELVDRAN